MTRSLGMTTAAAAILCTTASLAGAQGVTPTHTFETPMKFDPFSGEVVMATMIAPPAGETILRTELHIEWTTDGTQPASLFGMHLSTYLESGPTPTWSLTGADFGWGSAAGTYSAVVSTDLLNGTISGGLPGFPSSLSLNLEAAGGGGLYGAIGHQSKIVFELGPRMTGDVSFVSLSAGGSQNLNLNAGPTVGPGLLYVVAGSVTGTAPGLQVDGVHIPLLVDSYTVFSLANANMGPFVNTLGTLDTAGRAAAQLVIPASSNPGLAGTTLHHTMLGFDQLQPGIFCASNVVDLTLIP
jgi:hypothetical protein